MKPRWILGLPLALALVGLLALASPAAGAFDVGGEFERAYWGSTPSEASPGDHGRLLTVEIRNADTIAFHAVEAELRDHANLTPSYTGAEKVNRGASFAVGDLWKARFRVDLDDNLTVGDELDLDLRLTMRASEGGSGFSEDEILRDTLDVAVPVPGRTSLDVETQTPSIPRDTRATIPLAITNTGDGPAGTLDISAAPAAGADLRVPSAGSTTRVDELTAGETTTIPLAVIAPGTTGLHDLQVTIRYASTVGEPEVENRTVPINVAYRSIDPVQVRLVDGTATAGRVNELTFRVENQGSTELDDLELHVSPRAEAAQPGGSAVTPLNGTGVAGVGDLAPGETGTAEVSVYASEDAPDLVPLDVVVQWRDPSGLDRDVERSFGLVVLGAIEVQMTGLDARLHEDAGEIVVEGRITNTGNTEAANVYLRLEPADGVEGTEPVYQGDLDPDSPIPFTLRSPADPDQAPDSLTLRLTWTDDQGRARELTESVGVRPAPPSPASAGDGENGTPGLTPLAALAAIAAAGLLRRRGA
jgi:hypothetical protein